MRHLARPISLALVKAVFQAFQSVPEWESGLEFATALESSRIFSLDAAMSPVTAQVTASSLERCLLLFSWTSRISSCATGLVLVWLSSFSFLVLESVSAWTKTS